MRTRTMIGAGAAAAGLASTVILASPALAAPAQVQHAKNVTETFIDTIDCSGEADATISVTYNAVEKTSVTPNGGLHVTFTQSGSFTAVPLDGSQSATGRFAVWGGFNQNASTATGTFTFNIQGKYADGTALSVHAVDHFNTRPDGVEFFFTKCRE